MKNLGKIVILALLATVLTAFTSYYILDSVQQQREGTFQAEMAKALAAHAAHHEADSEQILQALLPNAEKWWPNGPHLVETLAWIGTIERVEHKYDQAKPVLERAEALAEAQGTPSTVAVGRAKMNLGIIARDEPDDVAAERLFTEAADILAKDPGRGWGDADASLLNLGYLADKEGRYPEAVSYFTRSIAGYETTFRNQPEADAANAHMQLANLYSRLDNYNEAAKQFEMSLRIYKQIEGPHGTDVLHALSSLAIVQQGEGPTNPAQDQLEQSIGDSKDLANANGATLINLGNIARDRKQFTEAEALFQRACQAYEKAATPDDIGLANALENLGALYRDQQQFDISKAEAPLKRALAIREKVFGPENPETAKTLSDLSLLYFYEKNFAAAEEFARRALPLEEKAFGADSLPVSTTLNRLGISERDSGKFQEAEANLKKALAIRERKHAPAEWIVISLENLACVYAMQGQSAQAQPLMARAQAIRVHSSSN